MTVTAQVLFDLPQREIASLLRHKLNRCVSASLIAGFTTVEGIEAIAVPLRTTLRKLVHLVVGAGTWRAFDALDRLASAGVHPPHYLSIWGTVGRPPARTPSTDSFDITRCSTARFT